jgi:16S rRNA (cytidine1402-2'-O)-methyltransferase
LTKKFEEYRRGIAAELLAHFKIHEPRGEFCLVLASADNKAIKAEQAGD